MSPRFSTSSFVDIMATLSSGKNNLGSAFSTSILGHISTSNKYDTISRFPPSELYLKLESIFLVYRLLGLLYDPVHDDDF